MKTELFAPADYDINENVNVRIEQLSFSGVNLRSLKNQCIKVVGHDNENSINTSLIETVSALEESIKVTKETKVTDKDKRPTNA